MALYTLLSLFILSCVSALPNQQVERRGLFPRGCGITSCNFGAIIINPAPGIPCTCADDPNGCPVKRDTTGLSPRCILPSCETTTSCSFQRPFRDPTTNLCTCQKCPVGMKCCPGGHTSGSTCLPFNIWSKVRVELGTGRCYCPDTPDPQERKRDLSKTTSSTSSSTFSTITTESSRMPTSTSSTTSPPPTSSTDTPPSNPCTGHKCPPLEFPRIVDGACVCRGFGPIPGPDPIPDPIQAPDCLNAFCPFPGIAVFNDFLQICECPPLENPEDCGVLDCVEGWFVAVDPITSRCRCEIGTIPDCGSHSCPWPGVPFFSEVAQGCGCPVIENPENCLLLDCAEGGRVVIDPVTRRCRCV